MRERATNGAALRELRGAKINLNASCNGATPDGSAASLVTRFQALVDGASSVEGTRGQVNFYTAATDSDQELIDHNKPLGNDPQSTHVLVHGTKPMVLVEPKKWTPPVYRLIG